MGICPKCGVKLGDNETIQWQCSSCNNELSWNFKEFTRTVRAKQYQIDMKKQQMTNKTVKTTKHIKNAVVILAVLFAISFFGNGFLFYQFNNTQQKLSQNIINNTDAEIVSLNSQKSELQTDLQGLQTDHDLLNQSYEELNKNYKSVSEMLSDCKRKLSDRQDKIDELKNKIDNKNETISNLKEKISSLKSENKSLQTELEVNNNDSYLSDSTTYTVYITEYGEKYHRAGCRYLWNSSYEISLSDAKSRGYTPCNVCNP